MAPKRSDAVRGPLSGVAVVELAGLGPGPFCGMVLADLGADVIRVDRLFPSPGRPVASPRFDLHNRSKRSIAVDLKQAGGREVVLRLAGRSDALIEGFRPGVTERLGIGPAACLARNSRLVYGRMTGWGQDGPLAGTAGHDIDYIARSGVLGLIGGDDPVVPINLIGDYGGGGMLLAVGILAGILSARSTGGGQVVDAAMVDGSALLSTSIHGLLAEGDWFERRSSNILDGGAPFYSVYETRDKRHLAVGALEPQFFASLLVGLGLEPGDVGDQADRAGWPRMRSLFEKSIGSRSLQEWESRFEGTDACVAPVLTLTEAQSSPANTARAVFIEVDGVAQPGPAPRFSETPLPVPSAPSIPGGDTMEVLATLGYTEAEIVMLGRQGAVALATPEEL